MSEVFFNSGYGDITERNQSLFVPFTDNTKKAGGKVATVNRQVYQFRYSQASGVKQTEHGMISDNQRGGVLWCGQKPVYFVNGECFW